MKKVKTAFMLNPEQVQELEERRKITKKNGEHRFSNRIRGVLLVGRDQMTPEKAAEICEVHARKVREWLRWYREEGVEGLKDGAHTGRRSRLKDEQKEELKTIIIAGPAASGLDTGIWTAPIVCRVIKQHFEVEFSASRVQRLLHALGFSVQYPKKVLSGADKQAQANWVENELPAIKKKSLKSVES
jgi:transposase